MLSKIIKECIDNFINEIEYNYHVGNIKDVNDVRPHYSDNKSMMRGRDTGHFGSGMYFSTYDGKYNNDSINPRLIQIDKNVYRVDFDLYKNLYRVRDERHGDMLFNTLRNLNNLYYKVSDSNFNCRKNYLIIYRNCQALGLNCPSYRELINMALDLNKNNSDKRSFSTLFMEYNGFNGVNVSGVRKYDNTLHGSVIYDLSKIDRNSIRKVDVDYSKIPYVDSSVATNDELDDVEYDVLRDKGEFRAYKLKDLPINKALSILKSSNYIVSDLKYMKYDFDDNFIKKYLRLIYSKCNRNEIKNENILYNRDAIELIYNYKAFYFVNLLPMRKNDINYDMLLCLINQALWENNPEEILKEIIGNLNRELTPFEREILDKWLYEYNV